MLELHHMISSPLRDHQRGGVECGMQTVESTMKLLKLKFKAKKILDFSLRLIVNKSVWAS